MKLLCKLHSIQCCFIFYYLGSTGFVKLNIDGNYCMTFMAGNGQLAMISLNQFLSNPQTKARALLLIFLSFELNVWAYLFNIFSFELPAFIGNSQSIAIFLFDAYNSDIALFFRKFYGVVYDFFQDFP